MIKLFDWWFWNLKKIQVSWSSHLCRTVLPCSPLYSRPIIFNGTPIDRIYVLTGSIRSWTLWNGFACTNYLVDPSRQCSVEFPFNRTSTPLYPTDETGIGFKANPLSFCLINFDKGLTKILLIPNFVVHPHSSDQDQSFWRLDQNPTKAIKEGCSIFFR